MCLSPLFGMPKFKWSPPPSVQKSSFKLHMYDSYLMVSRAGWCHYLLKDYVSIFWDFIPRHEEYLRFLCVCVLCLSSRCFVISLNHINLLAALIACVSVCVCVGLSVSLSRVILEFVYLLSLHTNYGKSGEPHIWKNDIFGFLCDFFS